MSYAYGLHRTVEKEVIEKLLDGYHPRTGEPLAQEITAKRIAGQRLTYVIAFRRMSRRPGLQPMSPNADASRRPSIRP